jgi:hypothetical protein
MSLRRDNATPAPDAGSLPAVVQESGHALFALRQKLNQVDGPNRSLDDICGLLPSIRVLGGRPAPAWLLDLHRLLGGLSVSLTSVHLTALVLDPLFSFGWAELLVPFAAASLTVNCAWL